MAEETNNCFSPERNKLINIIVLSSEVPQYIKVIRKKSDEPLLIRSTLNGTQQTPFGECKTALANRVRNCCKSLGDHPFHLVPNITASAISGTITEKGDVKPPLCVKYYGGNVFVDEWNPNPLQKDDAIGAALNVIENQETCRDIGRVPKTRISNIGKGEGVKYQVDSTTFHFWELKTSWFFMTAKNMHLNRSLKMAMLLSRTVPFIFEPDWDELDAIDDDPNLLFKPLSMQFPKLEEPIENATYLEIRSYTKEKMKHLNIPKNYYLRTINDLVRCFVFSGFEHDYKLYDYILENKANFVSEYETLGGDLGTLEMETETLMKSSNKTKTSDW